MATKGGYSFTGWYTAATDGTLVIDSNGDIQSSVSNWTDSSGNWTLTANATLHAQFIPDIITDPTISFQDNVVTSGLVLQFDGMNNTGNGYNENSTTWKNLIADNYGTLSNASWNANALNFDGTTSNVIGPVVNSNYMSIETMFSVNTLNKVNTIITASAGGIRIIVDTDNHIKGQTNINSAWQYFDSGVVVSTETIYIVSVTFDGTSAKVYVNGELKNTTNISGTIGTPKGSAGLSLGCDIGSGNTCVNDYYLSGSIYSARVYNRALTAAEVRQNYNMDKLAIGEYSSMAPTVTILGATSSIDTIAGYQYEINESGTWNTYNSSSKPVISAQGETDIAARAYNSYNVMGPETSIGILVDTVAPTTTVEITNANNTLTATATATDDTSGVRSMYGWKLQTTTTCNSSTTGFTDTSTSTYNFTLSAMGWYYICSRTEDNAGNITYTLSDVVITSYMEYNYTGSYQTATIPQDGYYTIWTYGAQGGGGYKGGYSIGTTYLHAGEILYIYVGGQGAANSSTVSNSGGWNGGGKGGNNSGGYSYGGGGATDIRCFVNSSTGLCSSNTTDLTWNSTLGLNSRIMVAAGGGAGFKHASNTSYNGVGGYGGGHWGGAGTGSYSNSNTTSSAKALGATPTSGGVTNYGTGRDGSFGTGGGGSSAFGGGGGGGYYGGAQGYGKGGSGGSAFVSGYGGSNAITSASSRTHTNNTLHYSGKYFIRGGMAANNRSGNGYAKIAVANMSQRINLFNVRYIKDCTNNNSVNSYGNHWVEIQAIKDGVNVAKGKTVSGASTSSVIVDGNIDTANYVSTGTGNQCVTVDLGSVYAELDELAVWHYWSDGRTYYNHIMYTSADNTNWSQVINSEAAENFKGKHVTAWDQPLYQNNYTVHYASTSACPLNATTYADTSAQYGVVFNKANPTCAGYTFNGWTASGADFNSSTAKYGTTSNPTTAWANGNKGTYFKNFTTVDNGSVTLTANWRADTAAPTMTLSVSSGTTYAKSRSGTVTISDNMGLAAGTYTIKYKWSTSSVACSGMSSTKSITVSAGTNEASTTITISSGTGKGKLYICNSAAIKDQANNQLAASTVRSANMYLDNTKPTCSIVSSCLSTGYRAWTAYANDTDSGLKYYGTSSSYSGSNQESGYLSGSGTLNYYVKDKAGNTNSCSHKYSRCS